MFIPLHDANGLKHIKLQYVTLALIAANVVIWLVTGTPAISDEESIKRAYYAYGFIPAVINNFQELPPGVAVLPEHLNYLSYAFFHSDFMHLAGNMLFLWVFGDNVEDAMGHVRFFVFYMLCAAAGALLHGLMAPQSDVPLIGASGAAAGIIAAYLLLHPNVRIWVLALGRIPLRIPAIYAIGAWIAFQVWNFVMSPEDQVSWAAHVGGIIAGVILIVPMKRKDVPLFAAAEEPASVPEVASQKSEAAEAVDASPEAPPEAPPEAKEASHVENKKQPEQHQKRTSVPSVSKWGRQ